MKKVYLINALIPRDVYDKKIKYILPRGSDFRSKGEYMYGIYAWCSNKKIKDEFLKSRRNDIYNVVEIEFDDKEEFKKFKVEQKESYLDYRKFETEIRDESIEVLTTFNEFIQVTEYGEENLNEFSYSNIDLVDYLIFTDDIINSLDTIGYTSEFDKNCLDFDRFDNAGYNASFNLTSLGRQLKFDVQNELSILLNLFRFFFFK